MGVRSVAGLVALAAVAGLPSQSLAQYYPPGQQTYTPPPPGYDAPPSGYSRPYDRSSSGIRSEELPPPGGPLSASPSPGGTYQGEIGRAHV